MNQLPIFPEIKKIAGLNEKKHALIKKFENKLDLDGVDFETAHFVSGCKEKDGHLYNKGHMLADSKADEYYVNQSVGYCEDNFFGTLYFKTDVPGTFVAVWFEM